VVGGRLAALSLLASFALSLSCLAPMTLVLGTRDESVVVVPPRGGAHGVVYRRRAYRCARVDLLDVDLDTPGVSVRVHARRPVPGAGGWGVGDAFTLPVWCRLTGAVGGINGGFFGQEIAPGRKEVIGLLQLDGRVQAPAALYRSRGNRRITYAHSAFGVGGDGRPLIDWVVSDRRDRRRLLCYPRPEGLHDGRPWGARSALAGGPRLIHQGRVAVAARAERLASPGALPRTFVGYAVSRKGARHLVLATASAFAYADAACFLREYFVREYGVACEEATCLDGGPSSQLAYRSGHAVRSGLETDTAVPTCVLVHYDRSKGGN
jgi:Phosphodiester glycosidase